VLLLASFTSDPLTAQMLVETRPAHVGRGTLFQIRITPTLNTIVTGVEGRIAGEPLHFLPGDGLGWESVAAAPLSGGDSLPIMIVLVHGEGRDTINTQIGVGRPEFPVERLTVAPGLAEPDRAAERRVARDNALARRVSRRAHQTPRLWTDGFLLPRPGRITSAFGTTRQYNGAVVSRHLGTDFAGAIGDPVRATNNGRVALVANFYLAGKVIYLDHGDGLISAYFHLSQALVRPGQLVKRGEVIGRVGGSGRVTGPHLHWVMRYGATTVDPMSVVSLLGEATMGQDSGEP